MYMVNCPLTTSYQYLPTLITTALAAAGIPTPYIANANPIKFRAPVANASPIILTKAPPSQQVGTEATRRLLPEESDDFETASGWYVKGAVTDVITIEQTF